MYEVLKIIQSNLDDQKGTQVVTPPRKLDLHGSRGSRKKEKKFQVEIWRDSKTVVDWIHGEGREMEGRGMMWNMQRQLTDWWSDKVNLRTNENDGSDAHFSANTPVMTMTQE